MIEALNDKTTRQDVALTYWAVRRAFNAFKSFEKIDIECNKDMLFDRPKSETVMRLKEFCAHFCLSAK